MAYVSKRRGRPLTCKHNCGPFTQQQQPWTIKAVSTSADPNYTTRRSTVPLDSDSLCVSDGKRVGPVQSC